ncbi:MAG: potassium-transporting ATPase subunit KdpA, partial [Bacteroidota bacterium]
MTFEFMTGNGWLQLLLYFAVLFALVKPLGGFMARVYMGERNFLSPLLAPIEKLFYKASGINAEKD